MLHREESFSEVLERLNLARAGQQHLELLNWVISKIQKKPQLIKEIPDDFKLYESLGLALIEQTSKNNPHYEDIFKNLLKKLPTNIRYYKDICGMISANWGDAIAYIPLDYRTVNICNHALVSNIKNYLFVKERFDQEDVEGTTLREHDENMLLIMGNAIEQTLDSSMVRNKQKIIVERFIKEIGTSKYYREIFSYFKYLPSSNPYYYEIFDELIKQYGLYEAFEFIPPAIKNFKSSNTLYKGLNYEDICEIAIRGSIASLKYIPSTLENYESLCVTAVGIDEKAILYINPLASNYFEIISCCLKKNYDCLKYLFPLDDQKKAIKISDKDKYTLITGVTKDYIKNNELNQLLKFSDKLLEFAYHQKHQPWLKVFYEHSSLNDITFIIRSCGLAIKNILPDHRDYLFLCELALKAAGPEYVSVVLSEIKVEKSDKNYKPLLQLANDICKKSIDKIPAGSSRYLKMLIRVIKERNYWEGVVLVSPSATDAYQEIAGLSIKLSKGKSLELILPQTKDEQLYIEICRMAIQIDLRSLQFIPLNKWNDIFQDENFSKEIVCNNYTNPYWSSFDGDKKEYIEHFLKKYDLKNINGINSIVVYDAKFNYFEKFNAELPDEVAEIFDTYKIYSNHKKRKGHVLFITNQDIEVVLDFFKKNNLKMELVLLDHCVADANGLAGLSLDKIVNILDNYKDNIHYLKLLGCQSAGAEPPTAYQSEQGKNRQDRENKISEEFKKYCLENTFFKTMSKSRAASFLQDEITGQASKHCGLAVLAWGANKDDSDVKKYLILNLNNLIDASYVVVKTNDRYEVWYLERDLKNNIICEKAGLISNEKADRFISQLVYTSSEGNEKRAQDMLSTLKNNQLPSMTLQYLKPPHKKTIDLLTYDQQQVISKYTNHTRKKIDNKHPMYPQLKNSGSLPLFRSSIPIINDQAQLSESLAKKIIEQCDNKSIPLPTDGVKAYYGVINPDRKEGKILPAKRDHFKSMTYKKQ